MTVTLTIPGRMPGINEFIAAQNVSRFKGNKMKQDNQSLVFWLCKSQIPRVRFEKPVRLSYAFYEPNMKRDLDNIAGFPHKVIQDGLVQARVLQNDGWKGVKSFSDTFFLDKKNPRIEVTISDEEDETNG